ncbi:hypothetical protein SAMN04488571_10410 [Methanoculleus thermophilus]|jgi:hypothetical protein|uniref:Uncharacterized protein n=1 Tax=Methanoculleus thermophilus TaxID=2200 RepID=A0A1G8Z9W5_9EURY|nr:hypothetical protein SAMN04488571_10410 [Methanoculleus thermophilus]
MRGNHPFIDPRTPFFITENSLPGFEEIFNNLNVHRPLCAKAEITFESI